MLTGNLLLYTRRSGKLIPRLLEPGSPAVAEAAETIVRLCQGHRGRRRGELEELLQAAPPELPLKVYKGLGKLMLERCNFTVGSEVEPEKLRADLFDGAARAWRGNKAGPPSSWRGRVLADAAARHGLTAEQAEAALYADLAENQLLEEIRPITPEWLILRYNVAQVQGLLLRAEQLTLNAPSAPPRRLRQLFRYLKFFGLLFRVERWDETGLELVLDGPLSLLGQGSRYGFNLAQFLPVWLHWEAPWRLRATIVPRPGHKPALLDLKPHPWLKSHYPDQGQWVPEELQRFLEGFRGLDSPWRVRQAEGLLALPGNRCLVPDLEFVHQGTGARLFLEFLPYPVPERAAQLLNLIAQRGRGDYLLATRRVPALEELAGGNRALFTFRRSLLPGPVLKALEEFTADR